MSTARNIKFVLPPTAPLRYKTACFSTSTTCIDVINKLSDLCHFVNFSESGYALYLPKGNGTRGRWLEDDKTLADYPLNLDETIELRKKPGFRSNPNMTPIETMALKEGSTLRYSSQTKLWIPCILRLHNTKLLILSTEHDNDPDVILFSNVTAVAEESNKKYVFYVTALEMKSDFRCKNNADKLEWVKVLKETIGTVNPAFATPSKSPRSPTTSSRSVSFLTLGRSSSSSITPPASPVKPSPSLTESAPPLSLRTSTDDTMSPKEERKKYSFLTLRTKKSKDKDSIAIAGRPPKRNSKEMKENEEKKNRPTRKERALPAVNEQPEPQEEEEENPLARARSHSAAGAIHMPSMPSISSMLKQSSMTKLPLVPDATATPTGEGETKGDGEMQNLKDKLQQQTEQTRQLEEKYQKLLMKYSDMSKYYHADSPAPTEPEKTVEEQPPQQPAKKSGSAKWRTFTLSPSFSRKSDPEVLELKLELQQVKAENRIMKMQVGRLERSESKRDLKQQMAARGKNNERTMSVSVSNNETDLAAFSHALTHSGSEKSLASSTGGEDELHEGRMRSLSMAPQLLSNNRHLGEEEVLRMQVASLREQLQESQRLLKREEEARAAIDREFTQYRTRTQPVDESALVDMEGMTRILQQSLNELKEKLAAAATLAPPANGNVEDDDEDEEMYEEEEFSEDE